MAFRPPNFSPVLPLSTGAAASSTLAGVLQQFGQRRDREKQQRQELLAALELQNLKSRNDQAFAQLQSKLRIGEGQAEFEREAPARLFEKQELGSQEFQAQLDRESREKIAGISAGTSTGEEFRLSKEGTALTLKFQERAEKFSGDFQVVRNNLVNIEAATDRIISNPELTSRVATDQAVIISFNKILDPTSVVRESEYERTPANISVVNRARAWWQRIQKGGVIPVEDIVEIRDTARQMAELRREIINKKLQKQIRDPAIKRNLDPEVIAPLFQPVRFNQQGAPAQTPTPTPEGQPGVVQPPPPSGDVDAFIKSLGIK